MSADLKGYLISEFKTGINTYMQPWQRPIDSFQPLVNAYVNRGTVNKRSGYSLFGQLGDGNPVMGLMRYVDEATGAVSLLAASTQNLYLWNGTAFGSAITLPSGFSGNITNFFNSTSWQASAEAASYLYMTNDVDPVTLWDGSTATQPTLYTDTGETTTISTCLDVQVYKQRLLFIRPILVTDTTPYEQNQSIYWSAISNPTNTVTDVAGNGGFLAAPTGDVIINAEFIRDVLVVFFTNSTWIFRYTGNDAEPFRWDKVNNTKSTNAPYGSIAYDERVTSIGATGLIACDGVNVQRYDIPIIDYYETFFSEAYFGQAFSQRYDNLNQGWTLYVSNQGGVDPQGNPFPLVGSIAPGSDSALIYNFVENSWATYKFQIPLTCLGTYFSQTGATWESLQQEWENTDSIWASFSQQKAAPILLAGDTTGNVWFMDNEDEVVDYWFTGDPLVQTPISIIPDIVTTRWNPVMTIGQKVQFTYIDIYYYIASVDATDPVQVTLNFFVDNSENKALSRTMTLDGPVNSEYAWKRIYVNIIGEFFQMEIDPNVDSFIQFLGFILWCKPAGRLTP